MFNVKEPQILGHPHLLADGGVPIDVAIPLVHESSPIRHAVGIRSLFRADHGSIKVVTYFFVILAIPVRKAGREKCCKQ